MFVYEKISTLESRLLEELKGNSLEMARHKLDFFEHETLHSIYDELDILQNGFRLEGQQSQKSRREGDLEKEFNALFDMLKLPEGVHVL